MLMRSISRPGSVGGSTLAVATITAVLAGLVGLATSVPAQADGVDGPGTVVPTFEAPVGSPPGFQGCTPDGALDPNRRGYPNAIALDGEKLVVAGNFCGFRGEPVARMVRLTTSGQIDRTFQLQSPLPTPPSKLAILPDGSYLVIGQPPISLTATHSVNRVSSGGAALPVSLTLNLSVVTDLLVAREGDGDYLYVASEARTGTVVAPGNAPYLTKYRYTRDGNFRSTNFCPEGASSVTPGSGGDADLRSCAVVQEPGVGYKALLADADAIFAAGGANFQHAPGSPIPSAESRIPGTDVCGRRFTAGVVKLFYRTGEALADFGSCDAADH
ncbi:MAG: delta-60 repeat domain-containing protein, partial [Candidatus Nanopelagicales bacterium]